MGRPCILSEPEQAEVAKLYTVGRFPIAHIARAYGLWPQPVRTALEKQGAKFRGRSMFGREKAKKIKARYENGESMTQIADDLGVSSSPVKTALDLLDVEIRPNRTYFFNEHTFDVIDTEEKAYWLGFLYADGHSDRTSTRLTLKEKDKPHLVKFRNFVSGDMSISKTMYGTWQIELNSIHMVERMHSLGVVPYRSQFSLTKAEIPSELTRHFIRGYVDGDGCISNDLRVVILGRKDLLVWIVDTLHSQVGANKNRFRKRGNVFEVSWGGRYIFSHITKYLYKNASIFLDRKKDRVIRQAEWAKKKGHPEG